MKKRFLLLTLLLVPAGLQAQEAQVEKVRAPQTAVFAQPFAIQYQLSLPSKQEITLDENSFAPEFEITQTAFSHPTPDSGLYDLTVMPFALGKSTFTVTFLATKDGETTSLQTDPVYVEISPAKTFPDKKFREIRPPHVPTSWKTWLLILLVIAAILYTLHCWRRRFKDNTLRLRDIDDRRPCDEIALSKIEALLASGLWEQKAYKVFYITLTEILREYLWKQFKVDTSSDTSAELLRRVKNMPIMQPLLVKLRDFLNSGDLVKFAKAEPDEGIRNKDIQILREIVQETTPPKTPVEEKKA
ncbi:MAG: hypothetical protein IKO35_05890 [Elusimicrobiaceae bacterium]|nr:hypothetical protein [Elusimicrobiaceae bacterium]